MKYIFLLLCFLIVTGGYAQKKGQARVDSLLEVFNSGLYIKKNETDKIKLLKDLSFSYYNISYELGIKYGQIGLTLAENTGWKRGIGDGANILGANFLANAEYVKASVCFQKAYDAFKDLNDKAGMASNMTNLSIVCIYQGDYAKALEYNFNALKIDESLGDKSEIAKDLGNIGSVYTQTSDYKKALTYQFKALKINEEIGDSFHIREDLGNIGGIYDYLHDYPKALEYIFRTLELAKAAGANGEVGKDLSNISSVYNDEKNYAGGAILRF